MNGMDVCVVFLCVNKFIDFDVVAVIIVKMKFIKVVEMM